MRRDPYKELMFRKRLIPRVVGAAIIFMTILIVIIILQMNERAVILNEGIVKSVPMLRDETVAKLGEIYVRKENEFESEIKNIILGIANRKNKRGDEIYYGVNGKRNVDEMINNDYVNGVDLTYIKSDSNRKDGESNFNDLLAVISSIYGSDADRYESEIIELFDYLFDISHTYYSESTELYPCEHGCAWTKYYCGDNNVIGTLSVSEGGGGEEVKYYKSDMYMGESGKYGLMYNPFLINKRTNYQGLIDLAGNETKMKTTYQYKDLKITITHSDGMTNESHTIVTKGDTVVAEDDEIFLVNEPDGYCFVCSGGRDKFTSTTMKYGGCNSHVVCHCRNAVSTKKFRDEEDTIGYWVDWNMGKEKENCDNYSVHEAECTHDCECEGDCTHKCDDPILLDSGYYVCEGHTHYACPGHIAVCCFGHTTLKLYVSILYHEGILNELQKIKDEIVE